MNRFGMLSIGFACVACIGFADAAETSDPTGNWKWSVTRGGNDVDLSLKLKFIDDKLTGTITLPNKDDIEIESASFKDNQVMFSVTHQDATSQKITTTYNGKIDGDTIKGKAVLTSSKGFKTRSDWEPKREKP